MTVSAPFYAAGFFRRNTIMPSMPNGSRASLPGSGTMTVTAWSTRLLSLAQFCDQSRSNC